MERNGSDEPGSDSSGPAALAQELQGLDGVTKAEVVGDSYHGSYVRVYSDGLSLDELTEVTDRYSHEVTII